MYIRRKVFSVILDEDGDERLFSTNEIINEDDYLDEVMYSDMSTGEKVGLGVAGTGALAGAGLYGNRLYQVRKAAIEAAGGKEAWKALDKEGKKNLKKAVTEGLKESAWKDMNWKQRGIKYGKKAGLAGAGLAAAGLAGYGISRYNRKQKNHSFYDEDDYLDEVMYSDKMSTGEKVGLGVAGTGALAGAGLYGNRLYQVRKAAIEKAGGKEAWKALDKEGKKNLKKAYLEELEKKAWKDAKWGERATKYGKKAGLAGAGLAAAGLAGYGISRYNRKNK